MANRPKPILFGLVFLLGVIIFFAVKYQGPSLVKLLYDNSSFGVLNKISGAKAAQSLDFYQGRTDDTLFGPFCSILSGILLLSFCLWRLPRLNSYKFGYAVLFYFIATRFEVLFHPPYGEAIIGHFSDAIWLLRHNFDYASYFRLKAFTIGSPQHYPVSIYPSFLALLMKILPSVKSFLFVNHLLVFAMSAATVSLFREILDKFFDKKTALLGAVTLLSLPLYQSMTEVLNLEIPCAYFALKAAFFLTRRRVIPATISAVMSLLIKAPGGIICALVFLVSILLALCETERKGRVSDVLWGTAALLAGALKFIARSHLIGFQPKHNTVKFMAGWPNLKIMPVMWIFILCTIVITAHAVYKAATNRERGFSLRVFLDEKLSTIIMLLSGALWFALYINFSVMGYRYELLLAPFFVFVVLLAFSKTVKGKALKILLTCVIVISLFGSHGFFYKKNIESSIYSFNFLERSLEYRNDLKLDIEIAKYIESHFSKITIGAPFVIAQLLVLPEVGYVKKPMDVVIYAAAVDQEGMRSFNGFDTIDPLRTVWIGFFKNHLTSAFAYPIGEHDKILRTFMVGDKKAAVFVGGFAIERMRRVIFHIK